MSGSAPDRSPREGETGRPLIAVLDYGMGNLHSVSRAVERVGGRVSVTGDPDDVARADALIVPGVGAFGACIGNLRASGLDRAILRFAERGRPLFAVCLGMQILFEGSEEGGPPGLGLFPGSVRRLTGPVKVPHMGWNEVTWTADHPYVRSLRDRTHFYFVHSYAADPVSPFTVATAKHGRTFAAAAARENLFGVQFHPEKSSQAGLALYEAFVKETG